MYKDRNPISYFFYNLCESILSKKYSIKMTIFQNKKDK